MKKKEKNIRFMGVRKGMIHHLITNAKILKNIRSEINKNILGTGKILIGL